MRVGRGAFYLGFGIRTNIDKNRPESVRPQNSLLRIGFFNKTELELLRLPQRTTATTATTQLQTEF